MAPPHDGPLGAVAGESNAVLGHLPGVSRRGRRPRARIRRRGPAAEQGGPPDRHRRRPRRGGRPPRDGPPARPAAASPLHRAERLPRGARLDAPRPDRRRARDPQPGAPRAPLLLLRGLGARAVLVDAPPGPAADPARRRGVGPRPHAGDGRGRRPRPEGHHARRPPLLQPARGPPALGASGQGRRRPPDRPAPLRAAPGCPLVRGKRRGRGTLRRAARL